MNFIIIRWSSRNGLVWEERKEERKEFFLNDDDDEPFGATNVTAATTKIKLTITEIKKTIKKNNNNSQ